MFLFSFQCSECDLVFTTQYEAMRHKVSHSNETTYHCPACPMTWLRYAYLLNHIKKYHHGLKWETEEALEANKQSQDAEIIE